MGMYVCTVVVDDLPCWVEEAAKSLSFESIPIYVAPWGSLVDTGDQTVSPVTPGEPAPQATQAHAPQEPLPPRMKLHRAVKKHDATANIYI